MSTWTSKPTWKNRDPGRMDTWLITRHGDHFSPPRIRLWWLWDPFQIGGGYWNNLANWNDSEIPRGGGIHSLTALVLGMSFFSSPRAAQSPTEVNVAAGVVSCRSVDDVFFFAQVSPWNGWFYSDGFVEHEENPSKNEFKQIGEVHLTWEEWCSWQLWACGFWCGWSLQPGDRTGFANICLLQKSPKNKLLTIIFSSMIWVLNSETNTCIHRKRAGGPLGWYP